MENNLEKGRDTAQTFAALQENLSLPCMDGNSESLSALYVFMAHKWTLLVLGALLKGTRRTGDLQRNIEGISQKMLTETLKKLLQFGMVTRTVFPEVPPHVEYELTAFGMSTVHPITAMVRWAAEWDSELAKLAARAK